MKKNVGWLVICLLFLAGPVMALFCNQCGKTIPDNSRFCSFCGATQAAQKALPHSAVSSKTLPGSPKGAFGPFSAGLAGKIRNPEFLALFQKLDRLEENLKLSLISDPNCRNFVQGRLNPGVDAIKNYLLQHKIRLDANQAKLLGLYKSFYSAILAGTVAMGYEKAVAMENVTQLAVLKNYLRTHFDDENQEYLSRIEKNFSNELQDIYKRIVELDSHAGFASPGICYQVKKDGLVSNGKGVNFVFRINTTERKVGDQIAISDSNRKEIGKLILKSKEAETRVYECFLPFGNFSEKKCRSIFLDIPQRSQYKISWQKQRVEFIVFPPLERDCGSDFYLEANHGSDPGTTRKNYLAGLGLF